MKYLVIAVFVLLGAEPAVADWSFTSWGMSPEQTVQASEGKARMIPTGSVSCTFKDTTCMAVMPSYSIEPFTFSVRFGFDGEAKLNSVLLHTEGEQFYELERALIGAFGAPISTVNGNFPNRIWRDTANGNKVRLINVFSETIIEYTPLAMGFVTGKNSFTATGAARENYAASRTSTSEIIGRSSDKRDEFSACVLTKARTSGGNPLIAASAAAEFCASDKITSQENDETVDFH